MPDWTECVIDASMGCQDGMFCFCPVEHGPVGEQIVTGVNYISPVPPAGMRLTGVMHPDGVTQCEAFYQEHRAAIDALFAAREEPDA